MLQAKLYLKKESEELRSLTAHVTVTREARDCRCHLTATELSPKPHTQLDLDYCEIATEIEPEASLRLTGMLAC